jgi:hypothetical protein
MNDDPPRSLQHDRFLHVLGEFEALEQAAVASAHAAFALNATLGHAAEMVNSAERKQQIVGVFCALVEREMDLSGVVKACLTELAVVAQSEPRAGASAARKMLHDMHARVVQAMIGIRSCDALYGAAKILAPHADCFHSSSPLADALDNAYEALANVDFILCEGVDVTSH